MRRSPAVANQFYPGNPATLNQTLAHLIPSVSSGKKQKAIAVIAPHAGYVYSGGVAGETFAKIVIPEDVLLMGPNHHGYGATVGLMTDGQWDMPLGPVPLNDVLGKKLLASSDVVEPDDVCHRFEHSLEVQVPFLQHLQDKLTLTPIVVSHIPYQTCERLGRQLATTIREYGKSVLIVASSDMSHYESREAASAKDRLAIDNILALDPKGLYETVLGRGITMCGVMPATVALVAAKELGATKAELVRYTDSGEASGDTRQVVGYAGIIIS